MLLSSASLVVIIVSAVFSFFDLINVFLHFLVHG